MSGARTPTIDAVAAYLVDAAHQDSSVYTVVSVVKQFVTDGLSGPELLVALDRARMTSPGAAPALARYEGAIKNQLRA